MEEVLRNSNKVEILKTRFVQKQCVIFVLRSSYVFNVGKKSKHDFEVLLFAYDTFDRNEVLFYEYDDIYIYRFRSMYSNAFSP